GGSSSGWAPREGRYASRGADRVTRKSRLRKERRRMRPSGQRMAASGPAASRARRGRASILSWTGIDAPGGGMLAPRLTLGARLTLVGGKGGVGKTTIATALAVECADSGEPVTILSIDPAHSLGDALALDLGPDPTPHPALP